MLILASDMCPLPSSLACHAFRLTRATSSPESPEDFQSSAVWEVRGPRPGIHVRMHTHVFLITWKGPAEAKLCLLFAYLPLLPAWLLTSWPLLEVFNLICLNQPLGPWLFLRSLNIWKLEPVDWVIEKQTSLANSYHGHTVVLGSWPVLLQSVMLVRIGLSCHVFTLGL